MTDRLLQHPAPADPDPISGERGAVSPSPPPPELVERLEAIEARTWIDFYRAAPESIKAEAGLALIRSERLVVGVASAFDALAFNRVLAREGPLPSTELDRIVVRLRELGVPRLFFPWPPPVPDEAAEAALSARGFRVHNRWVKLWRGDEPAPEVPSALVVEPLDSRDRAAFQEVMITCFDYPRPLGAFFGVTVGWGGWHHFGIRDHGRLVAAAGLRIEGETAWLGPAGTLPAFRGRGAQKVLLARRIQEARAAGCTLMCTETAEPTADRRVPSFHNVRRVGFEIAYHRPNFVATVTDAP